MLEAIWKDLQAALDLAVLEEAAGMQKEATLSTFSRRDQHRKMTLFRARKTALFRANNQFKKKSHNLHRFDIVAWLNRFFRFFVERLQLFYLPIFFDKIWGLDVKLSPLQTLKILA